MMTLGKFATLSAVAATFVITNSFVQKQQFFPSIIYLTKSNASMMVLYNMAFVFVLIFGKILRKLFFGELRAAEVEHLYERSWYAVTETCLAMTIFRDEFNVRFVAMFTLLLFVKIFHWLAKDRVDFMEQSPNVTRLFHVRMVSLLMILGVCDSLFIYYSVKDFMEHGPSMLLLFGFECVVFSIVLLSTFIKYVLHSIDHGMDSPWDNKSMYLFYLELVVDFLKLSVYMSFFTIILKFYGLPLHIVRDLYVTFKSFLKRVNDMIQYRRATANMNERYPDATAEELTAADNTCIICREDMVVAKKLPCGHVFHLHCLRSWLERQQTCPTCRSPVLQSNATAAAAAEAREQAGENAAPPAAGGQGAAVAGGAGTPAPGAQQGQVPFQQPPQFWTGMGAQQAPGHAMPFVLPQQQVNNEAGSGTVPPFVLYGMGPPILLPPSVQSALNNQTTHTSPLSSGMGNLQTMTESELKAMEGDEKSKLIARIKWLQNMRNRIDSIVDDFALYQRVQEKPSEKSSDNASLPEEGASSGNLNVDSPQKNESAQVGGGSSRKGKEKATVQIVEELPVPTSEEAYKSAEELMKEEMRRKRSELFERKIHSTQ
eukprot:Nk52_evm32s2474 gene=Nk52_evmTU32s2474